MERSSNLLIYPSCEENEQGEKMRRERERERPMEITLEAENYEEPPFLKVVVNLHYLCYPFLPFCFIYLPIVLYYFA